mgnify:CR=1 FL=1
MERKKTNKDMSPRTISRGDFMAKSSMVVGTAMLFPKRLFSQDCNLTTDDIQGPYFIEGAPFRSILAHPDEPGQRLFISGRVLQSDCETPISGAMVEVWHANDAGCYSYNFECSTGNPEEDEYNLRGKLFSNENGQYAFETILPGIYANRPMHIHIKITIPDGQVLVSQLYFEGDELCESDPWCIGAGDRILSLEEDANGLHGEFDLIMDSTIDGIIPGDVNLDGIINVQDIIMVVGIIMGNIIPDDFQLYAADVNQDSLVDVLDIVAITGIIMGSRRSHGSLNSGNLTINDNSLFISTDGEIAGIQIFTKGDFRIVKETLPDNWNFYFDRDIILIFNDGNSSHIPEKLFEFEGDFEIVSNIISGWDSRRLMADVNINPIDFKLGDPYPNPFNPIVNIELNNFRSQNLKITVYDIRGRELEVLYSGSSQTGLRKLTWDASIYPTGIYFIKAKNNHQTRVKKVNLVK